MFHLCTSSWNDAISTHNKYFIFRDDLEIFFQLLREFLISSIALQHCAIRRTRKDEEMKTKLNYGFDDGAQKVHASRRHNALSG